MNSPHQGPVTQKMFPFDDVIMKLPMGCELNRSEISNHFYYMFHVHYVMLIDNAIYTHNVISPDYEGSRYLSLRKNQRSAYSTNLLETDCCPRLCAHNTQEHGCAGGHVDNNPCDRLDCNMKFSQSRIISL